MDETEIAAMFPVQGVDTTCEYMRQPDATTPDAQNVRIHDPLAERARGGSRPGIGKYNPDQVNGETYQVQHLNILVDPQAPALSGTAEVDDDSTTNGPFRVPHRKIRSGGNGRRPIVVDDSSPASDIAFVAKYREQPGNLSAMHEVPTPGSPVVDDLIVVIIRTSKSGSASALVDSVRNGEGIDFHQAGPAGNEYATLTDSTVGPETTYTLSFWWKPYDNAFDDTIRITPGETSLYEIVVLVYRNADPDGAVTNTCKREENTAEANPILPDLELDDTTGQVVIAVFSLLNTFYVSTDTGYIARYPPGANVAVVEASSLSGVGPENPEITTGAARPWLGMAVALTNGG